MHWQKSTQLVANRRTFVHVTRELVYCTVRPKCLDGAWFCHSTNMSSLDEYSNSMSINLKSLNPWPITQFILRPIQSNTNPGTICQSWKNCQSISNPPRLGQSRKQSKNQPICEQSLTNLLTKFQSSSINVNPYGLFRYTWRNCWDRLIIFTEDHFPYTTQSNLSQPRVDPMSIPCQSEDICASNQGTSVLYGQATSLNSGRFQWPS